MIPPRASTVPAPAPTRSAPSRRSLEKAANLLQQRGIVRMLREALPRAKDRRPIHEKLLSLQAVIFDLDYFGEENWEIEKSRLAARWAAVAAALAAFEQVPSPKKALTDVRAYMSVELAMRRGVAVSTRTIGRFYRLKSCDVRLLRGLLVALVPPANLAQSRAAWDLLDVISEVGDDLDDMIEDQSTYNGNRILCSFREKGVAATVDEYCAFLGRQRALALRLRAGMPATGSFRRARSICLAAIREASRLAGRIARFKPAVRSGAEGLHPTVRRAG